jgi:pimeloyl-ACP methyl ester carboxylesterase
MINPFVYEKGQPRVEKRVVGQNQHYRRYTISFPIAFPDLFQESNTAYGDYFQSLGHDKAPLVILVHGWGDHSVFPMHMLARNLTRQGMHCFVLYLPFHSKRFPPEMKKRRYNLTPEEWFAGYRIAVTDIRQIIDWAETVGEIDSSRVAVLGLSLGAITGSIVMGVDDRISTGIFIVSGGNTQKIAQHSRFSTFRRRYRISKQDYEVNQKSYLAYLELVKENGWEKVEPAQPYYLIDPLTYAYHLRGRPVLMINARWDEFIPAETSLEFQHACGDCELMWLPASHTSIWFFYPLVIQRISRFLKSAFLL